MRALVFALFALSLNLWLVPSTYAGFLDNMKKDLEKATKSMSREFNEPDSQDKNQSTSKEGKLSTTLSIESNVNGAKVLIDGKEIGETPLLDMRIKPGEHIIQVRKSRYQDWKKKSNIKEGKSMAFYVDLAEIERGIGKLFVKTSPDGARVRILNIKPKFRQGMELDQGKYHLEISAPGFSTKKFWIKLSEGEDKTVDISLNRTTTKVSKTKKGKKQVKLRRDIENVLKGFTRILYGTSNFKQAPRYVCKDLVGNLEGPLQSQRMRKIDILSENSTYQMAVKYLDKAKINYDTFQFEIIEQTKNGVRVKYKMRFEPLIIYPESGTPLLYLLVFRKMLMNYISLRKIESGKYAVLPHND